MGVAGMGYSELDRPTCWKNNVQPQRARSPQVPCPKPESHPLPSTSSDSSPTPGPFGQFAGPRSAGSPSKSPEKMTRAPSTSPVRWPVAVLHGAVLAAGAVPLATVPVLYLCLCLCLSSPPVYYPTLCRSANSVLSFASPFSPHLSFSTPPLRAF